MLDRRMFRLYDYWLLAVVIVLLSLGVAMVYSATRGDPENERLPVDQAITGLVGLILLLLVSTYDYVLLKNFAWPIYLLTLVALAVVLIPGIGVTNFGAQRWYAIGPIQVQPGEFAKILLTVVLAKFIADRHNKRPYFETVVISLALITPCVVLIFRQPNLSTALTIVFLWLALVFVGGIERQHIIIIALAGLALVFIVVELNLLQPYQWRRLQLLANPDPETLAPGATYQIDQARIALGSGGWTGQGYLQGRQNQLRFLSVRHTDFIFSVIGEELGFAGALLFIGLLIVVITRTLRAAYVARDIFGQLLCTGIAATLFLQTYINIGMQVGIMPVTGVVLPFISYGRSNLIVLLAAIGLVQSVAMRHKRIEF
jgi:rod shape determining protein RodA